jgi:hypothetical protein
MFYCMLTHDKGRGSGRNDSIIAMRKMGSSAPKNPRFAQKGSALSSVGVYKNAIGSDKNHASGRSAKDRRTKGSSRHLVGIPGALWHCELCDKDVTNDKECIKQHKESAFHQRKDRQASAPDVERPVRVHHCERCNLDMDNTPQLVNAHNKSPEHLRLMSYMQNGDSRSDGPLLVASTAAGNQGQQWIAIRKKNGEVIHKLVKQRKANPAAATGTGAACACDVHRCCLRC